MSALYGGSELATIAYEAEAIPTTAQLALASETLLLGVSISAFHAAITNWLYCESGLSYI